VPSRPHSDDLTAKARVRHAAFELFADRGFAATTVREIAAAAEVSPGLVIHHFGSKAGVREAVDDHIGELFDAAFDTVPMDATADVISRAAGFAFGSVIATDPTLRAYIRRMLVEQPTTGWTMLDRVHDALERGVTQLQRAGLVRPEVATRWLPFQIMFNSLGALVFEPFLQHRLNGTAYDPDVVSERQAANVALMARGIEPDAT